MNWLSGSIRWVMLASGLLTGTMIQAVFAPQAALRSFFGTTLEGPAAEIVVRNWGGLIALVGAALIYGAFTPAARPVALMLGIVSKSVFIALVLTYGQAFLSHQAGVAVAVDAAMVLIFVAYLVSLRGAASR
jgi:hypothetical protein